MRPPCKTFSCLLALALGLGTSTYADAADDGVYGRFAGDIDARASLGVATAASPSTQFVGRVSAQYLSTAGVYLVYADALHGAPSDAWRSLAAGVGISPIFLARYGRNFENLSQFLDLLLDSVGFELGALWEVEPAVRWSHPLRPGAELALDLAIPLLARATGPCLDLRTALRWHPWEVAQDAAPAAPERRVMVSLTLGWRQILRTHVVDVGDQSSE
jgi:hypothetical protein